MQRVMPDGVVTADTFEIGLGAAIDAKHIPEYFYREFVPKDDAPPFTLLPGYVPPSEPSADAEKPWTPNY